MYADGGPGHLIHVPGKVTPPPLASHPATTSS